MTEPLKPTGFWSYTSSDDTASGGRLSQLRRLLADALQLRIGRTPQLHIFQDVAAIPHGANWLEEIHRALADSSFFIPIVTPAFLQSEMCCQEVLHFREREAAIGRDDLILPLHYINVDDVDPHRPSEVHDPAMLELLRSRQWIDFRPLRFRDPNGEDVSLKLDALAGSIRAALRRGGTTVVQAADGPSRGPGPAQAEPTAVPVSPPPVEPGSVAGASADPLDREEVGETDPALPAGAAALLASRASTAGATGATVAAGAVTDGAPQAGPESSPRPVGASAAQPSAAAAPTRPGRRLAWWGAAGVAVLLLAGAFVFLQQRGPPGQTAQLAMPAPAQPAAPPATQAVPAGPAAAPALTAPPEPAAGTVTRDCATCPELVLIPPGSFVMGVPPEEDDREGLLRSDDDEARPQHKVTIARAFWLGRYPVTRSEFAAFVHDTGYEDDFKVWRDPGFPQTDSDPVVGVSDADAAAYVVWLSRKTGRTYRLPSEAEWEYAARAGTTTARFWGDDRDRTAACGYANVADETWRKAAEYKPDKSRSFNCNDGYANTSPVGKFLPNGFGLYDMLGNVWQWTADCYYKGYSGAPGDGSTRTAADCGLRVLRGGSWNDGPSSVRTGYRFVFDTGARAIDLSDPEGIGVRLARTR